MAVAEDLIETVHGIDDVLLELRRAADPHPAPARQRDATAAGSQTFGYSRPSPGSLTSVGAMRSLRPKLGPKAALVALRARARPQGAAPPRATVAPPGHGGGQGALVPDRRRSHTHCNPPWRGPGNLPHRRVLKRSSFHCVTIKN